MLLGWQTTLQGDFSTDFARDIFGEECMKDQKRRDFIKKLKPSMPRADLRMTFLNIISCLGLRYRVPGCSGLSLGSAQSQHW